MSRQPGPTYSLTHIQEAVRNGAYVVTQSGLAGAAALGLDVEDIESCVLALDEGDFYKTMASHKVPGLMQDVYRPTFETLSIYLKLQVGKGSAVVISFKGDESR